MSGAPSYHRAEVILGDVVQMLDQADILEDGREVVPLGRDGATAFVWIAGRRFSLTLTHRDEPLLDT